ncbi:MAG: substrate-binding domain-containing protein [bacterium]|nr:substrate-binding domain-containing protein [bacterium]
MKNNKLTTKKHEIYDYLLERIKQGRYNYGEFIPSEKVLAQKFGVSRPTVNRSIARLKEEGFVDRKAGYGTFVTYKEKERGNLNFGLLVPGLKDAEIFGPICHTIANITEEYDFNLFWRENNFLSDSFKQYPEKVCQSYIEQHVDGVFFAPVSLTPNMEPINLNIVKGFSQAGIIVVLLDRDIMHWPQRGEYDLVGIDNFHAGYTVCQHLIDQGCRKISYVIDPFAADTGHIRIAGCQEALRRANISQELFQECHISRNTPDIALKIMKLGVPDAVICSNDIMAARVMQSCFDIGKNIPDDLLIAGFDDVQYARNLPVALTSFHQPGQEIAVAAVQTMLSRIASPALLPRRIYIQGELSKRKSTKRGHKLL